MAVHAERLIGYYRNRLAGRFFQRISIAATRCRRLFLAAAASAAGFGSCAGRGGAERLVPGQRLGLLKTPCSIHLSRIVNATHRQSTNQRINIEMESGTSLQASL